MKAKLMLKTLSKMMLRRESQLNGRDPKVFQMSPEFALQECSSTVSDRKTNGESLLAEVLTDDF